jgi:hypothetical protein
MIATAVALWWSFPFIANCQKQRDGYCLSKLNQANTEEVFRSGGY